MIRRWEIEAIKSENVDLRRDYDVLQNRLFKLERHLGLAWPGDWMEHVKAEPPKSCPVTVGHKHNWYPTVIKGEIGTFDGFTIFLHSGGLQ